MRCASAHRFAMGRAGALGPALTLCLTLGYALAFALVLTLLAAPAAKAQAQDSRSVYRCGEGQYSQTPCAGGRQLPVDDAPSAAQQREAQAANDRQAQMAARMRRDRLAEEQAAARRQPARIGPAAPAVVPHEADHGHHKPARHRKKPGKLGQMGGEKDPSAAQSGSAGGSQSTHSGRGAINARSADRRAYVPSAPR